LTRRRRLSRTARVIDLRLGGSPAGGSGVILGLVGEPVDADEIAFGGVVMVLARPEDEKRGYQGEEEKEFGGFIHM